jgi:Pyridine nucleotide-disulphide oxidoreductase, dimerisation domain
MKMLVAADSDEIPGFSVFGAEGSELMAAVQTAMVGGLPYTELHRAVYAHPTVAEGLTFLLRGTPATPPAELSRQAPPDSARRAPVGPENRWRDIR